MQTTLVDVAGLTPAVPQASGVVEKYVPRIFCLTTSMLRGDSPQNDCDAEVDVACSLFDCRFSIDNHLRLCSGVLSTMHDHGGPLCRVVCVSPTIRIVVTDVHSMF